MAWTTLRKFHYNSDITISVIAAYLIKVLILKSFVILVKWLFPIKIYVIYLIYFISLILSNTGILAKCYSSIFSTAQIKQHNSHSRLVYNYNNLIT